MADDDDDRQLDLVYFYGDGLLGHQTRETSIEASIRALRTAKTKAAEVFRLFEAEGAHGLTDDELARLMNEYPSARPRRIGLCHLGLLEDSGLRRQTRTGSPATVWRVKV